MCRWDARNIVVSSCTWCVCNCSCVGICLVHINANVIIQHVAIKPIIIILFYIIRKLLRIVGSSISYWDTLSMAKFISYGVTTKTAWGHTPSLHSPLFPTPMNCNNTWNFLNTVRKPPSHHRFIVGPGKHLFFTRSSQFHLSFTRLPWYSDTVTFAY